MIPLLILNRYTTSLLFIIELYIEFYNKTKELQLENAGGLSATRQKCPSACILVVTARAGTGSRYSQAVPVCRW
jgi:hypothetical protein